MRLSGGIFRSTQFQGWCVFLICIELLAFGFSNQLGKRMDFRSFYAAGVILRTSPGDLYDIAVQKRVQDTLVSPEDLALPFYHPSFEAALFAPVSMLSYRAAYLMWVALNCVIAGLAFLFAPFEKRLTAFVLFPPVFVGLLQGQDSILLLLLLALAFRELRCGSVLSAGALLGLGLFRPELMAPIAILLALRFGWRLFAGFLSSGAVCAATSFMLIGSHAFNEFCRLLLRASLATDYRSGSRLVMAVYPGFMPNLFGLVHLLGERFLRPPSEFVLVVVLSVVAFLFSAYLMRRLPTLGLAFSIAVCCALLVSYHLYLHDLALLLFPIALLTGRLPASLSMASYAVIYALFFSTRLNWLALVAFIVVGFLILAAAQSLGPREDERTAHAEVELAMPQP